MVFLTGGELGDDYLRDLENNLRDSYDFVGTPIHFVTRARTKR